ncbi:uncharacterized protein LY79DRAFT_310501 [Colletotrichum navitas]|uniref:Uncharacterized protein n=1 Tax=Colletotrichum navitas TaxID=681940 RepID=A0AAD8PTM8_9PEZI|nr:uncharacterized protein LY79DRAFT_310501 [Colletotrichum navitas]KAK1580331.1 hypothetical protein LY79DRAFT_310501 [Colletotrichum navitas]
MGRCRLLGWKGAALSFLFNSFDAVFYGLWSFARNQTRTSAHPISSLMIEESGEEQASACFLDGVSSERAGRGAWRSIASLSRMALPRVPIIINTPHRWNACHFPQSSSVQLPCHLPQKEDKKKKNRAS